MLRYWSAHPPHPPCWLSRFSGGSTASMTPLIEHSPKTRPRKTVAQTLILTHRHRSALRNIDQHALRVRGPWAHRPRKSSSIPCFLTCSSRTAAPDRTATAHGQHCPMPLNIVSAQPCSDSNLLLPSMTLRTRDDNSSPLLSRAPLGPAIDCNLHVCHCTVVYSHFGARSIRSGWAVEGRSSDAQRSEKSEAGLRLRKIANSTKLHRKIEISYAGRWGPRQTRRTMGRPC